MPEKSCRAHHAEIDLQPWPTVLSGRRGLPHVAAPRAAGGHRRSPAGRLAQTLTLSMAGLLGLVGVARGELVVARDGQPVAALLAQGHTQQAVVLRQYIKVITHAELPVVDKADASLDGPLIVLEIVDSIAGLSDRPTALQGYRIHADGKRLTLSARSERGLTYAVYGLLQDHLDVRFFASDCEIAPERTTLALADFNEVREPAFQVRSMFMALGPDRPDPWEVSNRGGGLPADIVVSRHGFYDWVHPSRYLEAHPEWYPLLDGKRQQHWLHGLCYSNPELAKQLAANIVERIRKDKLPAEVPIPVGQGDGFIACQCEVCRAVAKENESEAGPVILLLNRTLEAMSAEFPKHQLITFAYAQTIRMPKAIKPHPNLWINIVSSSAGGEGWGPFSGGDMIGTVRNNPQNELYRQATEQWAKAAPRRVTIWHWSTDFNDQSVEWPNLFTMADNLRFWREQGVAAVALQTTGGGGNWGWLKHWVWLKLMWNPDAEIEPLIREFLAGYYGPKAAPILWEYQQVVEQARKESGYAANACDGRAANALALIKGLFPPVILARMDALLEQATQAAATETESVYAQRVRHARAYSVDQLKLVEAAGVQPYPGGYFYPPETVKLSRIQDPRDGSFWLVPGATMDMAARVERLDEARKTTGAQEAGAAFIFRFWFQRGAGGKLTRIESSNLAVELCPNLLGTIISIVHKPTGKELLTGRFPLVEWHSGMQSMEWRIPELTPRRAAMEQWIQTDNWFYMGNKQRYLRTLELDEKSPVLKITRRFEGEKLGNEPGMPGTSSFPSTWHLNVPEPGKASLTVTVRGKTQTLPLGVKGSLDVPLMKVPEVGTQDDDTKVPEADALLAEIAGKTNAEQVEMVLDRGDGLRVRLTTPAAGWLKLGAAAEPEGKSVTLTLHGEPTRMKRVAHSLELPGVRLEVLAP